jgi:RNA polymerase sigma factor (sigma-70 family)
MSGLNDGFGEDLNAAEQSRDERSKDGRWAYIKGHGWQPVGPTEAEVTAHLRASKASLAAHARAWDRPHTPFEDLMQEALIEAWRAISEGHSPALAAWRARKAVNQHAQRELWTGQDTNRGNTKDVFRARGYVFIEDMLHHPAYLSKVEEGYFDGELVRAINDLTPRQREIVVRRFWLCDTYSEIAQGMGLATKTVINVWHDDVKPVLRQRLAHLEGVY